MKLLNVPNKVPKKSLKKSLNSRRYGQLLKHTPDIEIDKQIKQKQIKQKQIKQKQIKQKLINPNKKKSLKKKYVKNKSIKVQKINTNPNFQPIRKIYKQKEEPKKIKKLSNHNRYKSKNNVKIIIKKKKYIDNKRLNDIINSIQNKSNKEMIDELKQKGISVSGRSKRLLQDIYLFSVVDNINIKKEI